MVTHLQILPEDAVEIHIGGHNELMDIESYCVFYTALLSIIDVHYYFLYLNNSKQYK